MEIQLKPIAALLLAVATPACGGQPTPEQPVAGNTVSDAPNPPAPLPEQAKQTGGYTLAAGQGRDAAQAVRQEAERRGMSDIVIDERQSFQVMQGGRPVATLIAGEAKVPDAVNAACFAAVVREGRVSLVPTIGVGNWEAQTCEAAEAVGIVSGNAPVRFGIVYRAASPNAEGLEPVILRWDPTDHVLAADEALSQRASEQGAHSVAALRRIAR